MNLKRWIKTKSRMKTGKFSSNKSSLSLNFPQCLHEENPTLYPIIRDITEDLIYQIMGVDFSKLAIHSPALKDFDWQAYLTCSMIRMLKVAEALQTFGFPGMKILDIGSYFGNFSLVCAKMGYETHAIDSYQTYGNCFDFVLDRYKQNNITLHDFGKVGYNLHGLQAGSYDAVLCLGVIEHIPHTPRPLFEAINYVLKQNGILILETPNLAYIYNRQKLERGDSIFAPIQTQYHTNIPFEGHHREYTVEEIKWLIQQNKHQLLKLDTFIYSLYSMNVLSGIHHLNYLVMQRDYLMRELILSVSRR